MDSIGHTRDPNSTRVLDPLDRKIRRRNVEIRELGRL